MQVYREVNTCARWVDDVASAGCVRGLDGVFVAEIRGVAGRIAAVVPGDLRNNGRQTVFPLAVVGQRDLGQEAVGIDVVPRASAVADGVYQAVGVGQGNGAAVAGA